MPPAEVGPLLVPVLFQSRNDSRPADGRREGFELGLLPTMATNLLAKPSSKRLTGGGGD